MWFQRTFSAARNIGKQLEPISREQLVELRIPVRAINLLNRLRINASRYLPGEKVGLRSSVRRKPATEFREHRMYVPGDDVRYVDWKASARQEHIFIKQGEYQKKINIYILLDCSASMGWGDVPKSTSALLLAAAIGYSALAQGDQVTIVPIQGTLDDAGRNIKKRLLYGPISGKGQFPGLLNYFHSISFLGKYNLLDSIQEFCQNIASGSGLVFLISDLLANSPDLQTDIGMALKYLPAPTWNVVVFHLLHPDELKPKLKGEYEFQDIETRMSSNYDVNSKALHAYQARINGWRESIEYECNINNALYCLIQSEWSLDTKVIPLLRELNVLISI